MGDALFYHLTSSNAVQTLHALLPRAIKAQWQVELRGTDASRMAAMDQALWLGDEADFLPHGLAGGDHDADQPVLLTWSSDGAGRACIMTVEGADVTPEEVTAADRTCILFDGLDEAAVQRARDQWRALTGAGIKAQYWAQDGSRWEKRAES